MGSSKRKKPSPLPTGQGVHCMQLRSHTKKLKMEESLEVIASAVKHTRYTLRKRPDKPTRQKKTGVKYTVSRGMCASTHSKVASPKRGKEKRKIPFLPTEITWKILLLLRADVLHKVMRLVCRDWCKLITDPDFINAHLCKSATGLLVQSCSLPKTSQRSGYFVEVEEKKTNGSPAKRKRKYITPRSGKVIHIGRDSVIANCCDGLILLENPTREKYQIVNPTRKQRLTLAPPLDPSIRTFNNVALAHTSLSKEYKFVLPYVSVRDPLKFGVLISTIGGDNSWRYVEREHVPGLDHDLDHLPEFKVYSVGQFVYWHFFDHSVLLALDVETETMDQVNAPEGFLLQPSYPWRLYIKLERFLIMTVMVKCRDFIWDFWALVDTKNGEWTKLYEVDLRDKLPLLGIHGNKFVMPRLVLLEEDVVVFWIAKFGSFIGYRVKTGQIFKFGRCCRGIERMFGYVRSLVPVFHSRVAN